jgi:anti-sigma-K factor RskA
MPEHEYWDELAAGYALHGLSADEETAFTAHLASCEECAANVKDHELVAAQLGSISHYQDADEGAPSWESMRTAIVGDDPQPSAVVDLATRRRRYDLSRRSLSVAAAAVLVAGSGIATWRLTAGGSSGCSASDGCHVVKLDAARGKTLGSLTVRNGSVSVVPTNMPPAPAGKVYVLWQVPRDAQATPISEFTAGTKTPAPGALAVSYADTQQFAISLEPASSAPPEAPSNTLASGLAG